MRVQLIKNSKKVTAFGTFELFSIFLQSAMFGLLGLVGCRVGRRIDGQRLICDWLMVFLWDSP